MNRSVIVYGILLVGALIGAYLSWTHEPETKSSDGVEIARFASDDIEEIRYTSPKKRLVLRPRSDDRGRYWWVEQTTEKIRSEPKQEKSESPHGPPASPTSTEDAGGAASSDATSGTSKSDAGASTGDDAGAVASPTEAEETKAEKPTPESTETEETSEYKASSAMDRLLVNLDPLEADRRLPEPSDKRKKMYGFDDPKRSLTIVTNDGRERVFKIGKHTYGRQHVYVRDEMSGEYFVVKIGVIGPLKYSDTRLVEKSVTGIRERNIKRVLVQSDGNSVELAHHNIDDPTAAYWSVGADESEKSETANSWIGKLMRVSIEEYITDQDASSLETSLVVSVEPTDADKTTIQFFKGHSTEDEPSNYFAKSEFTKSLVKLNLSSAATLVEDVETLLDEQSREENGGSSNNEKTRE